MLLRWRARHRSVLPIATAARLPGQEVTGPTDFAIVSSASLDSTVSSPIVKPAVRETLISAWSASRNAFTAAKALVLLFSGIPNSGDGSCIHETPQFGQRSGRLAQRIRGKLTAVLHSLQRKKTDRISSRSKVISCSPFTPIPATSQPLLGSAKAGNASGSTARIPRALCLPSTAPWTHEVPSEAERSGSCNHYVPRAVAENRTGSQPSAFPLAIRSPKTTRGSTEAKIAIPRRCKWLAKDPNFPSSLGTFRLQRISRFVSPLSYPLSLGRWQGFGSLPFLRSSLGAVHLRLLRHVRNLFLTSGKSCLPDWLRVRTWFCTFFQLKQITPNWRFLLGARIALVSSSGRVGLSK